MHFEFCIREYDYIGEASVVSCVLQKQVVTSASSKPSDKLPYIPPYQYPKKEQNGTSLFISTLSINQHLTSTLPHVPVNCTA